MRPYRWIVMLALLLAAINQSFSMLDPYFFGKLGLDDLAAHPYENGYYKRQDTTAKKHRRQDQAQKGDPHGMEGDGPPVADAVHMGCDPVPGDCDRGGDGIAGRKALQEHYGQIIVQKFGATIFTDSLRHSIIKN